MAARLTSRQVAAAAKAAHLLHSRGGVQIIPSPGPAVPPEQPPRPPEPARSPEEVLTEAEALLEALGDHLPVIGLGLLAFVIFVAVAIVARSATMAALRKQNPTLRAMVAQLVYVFIIIFGLLVGLWVAVPTFRFAQIFASLGVTGLVLGFALRDIIENFVAGILILWRRPFGLGDQIRSGKYEGIVAEINFRSTILKTFDGIKVFIPNGKIFTEPVENLTGYRERRSMVVLGIDQNASVAQAREVILAALRDAEGVLREPPPLVLFDEVAEFTNNLRVFFWTRPPTRYSEVTTRSNVTERLYTALREANIQFPYPIRTLQIQSLPAERSDGSGPGQRTEPAASDRGDQSS